MNDRDDQSYGYLRGRLSCVDALLSSGLESDVVRLLNAGSTLEDVVALLTENYVGYEFVCDALLTWMASMHTVGEPFASQVMTAYLSKVLFRRFDARKADGTLGGGDLLPPWLEQMLQHEHWRAVLRQLHRENKSSALLDHASRNIDLMDVLRAASAATRAGNDATSDGATAPTDEKIFENMNAAVGSPSGFFGCMLALLWAQRNAGAFESIDRLEAAADFVAGLASYDERTFVCWLRIVLEAQRSVTSDVQRTCLQMLGEKMRRRALARASHGARAAYSEFIIRTLVILDGLLKAETREKTQLDALLRVLNNSAQEKDLATLEQLELADGDTGAGHSALSYAEVIDGLIVSLYEPGWVGSTQGRGRSVLASLVASGVRDFVGDRTELERALVKSAAVCAANAPGVPRSTLQRQVIGPLETLAVEYATVAYGVLLWVRQSLLKNPKPLDLKMVVPYYLYLLTRIAEKHSGLRQDVLALCSDAFENEMEEELDELIKLDVRRMYIVHMADLCRYGLGLAVLRIAQTWPARIDKSLVRSFIRELFSIAGPPYSAEFAGAFLSFLSKSEVLTTLRIDRDGLELLRRFVTECDSTNVAVQIPPAVRDALAASQ